MPKLKEINGNVLLTHWSVCFTNTIAWDVLSQGYVTEAGVKTSAYCSECDNSCMDEDRIRRCWGQGPEFCQQVKRVECDWFYENGTCFDEGMNGCCHPEYIGCNDDWIDTASELPKTLYTRMSVRDVPVHGPMYPL